MLPKSVSASSLQVSQECLRKYKATHIDRVSGSGNSAAMTGTAVHGALEKYVQDVYIDKIEPPSWPVMFNRYTEAFTETFGIEDWSMDEFNDGTAMLKKWLARCDLDNPEITVLNVETKESFNVPVTTTAGRANIPLNYIIDRLDQIGPNAYRVVDYKSIRVPMSHDDLRRKIQARIYALAVRIKYPNAELIKVEFDLLRHEPIGVILDREDQINTWRAVKSMTQRIVSAPEPPPATINSGCRFCPVASTCDKLLINTTHGTIESMSLDQLASLQDRISGQAKALSELETRISDQLVEYAKENGVMEYEAGDWDVKIKVSSRRNIDQKEVFKIIGPELIKKYGTINLTTIDRILKSDEITIDQKEKISALFYKTFGDPKATVVNRTFGLG